MLIAPARELAKAAALAASVSDPKSPIPILGNLLLTVGAGHATFIGAGPEASMSAMVATEDTEHGSVAVDARIAGLLKSFPDGALAKITLANGIFTLSCGRSRYRLDTLPAEEFPPFLSVDNSAEFTPSDEDRRRLFEIPAPAISTEWTRYCLCGLSLKSAGRRLIACGTNGTQLITTSVGASIELPHDGIIVPAKACNTIAKMDGCSIRISPNAIEAKTDAAVFAHRLINATFPAYERTIPPASGNSVEADRLELVEALKRLRLVASREKAVIHVAQLEWRDDELSLCLPKQADVGADVLHAVAGSDGKTSVAVGPFINFLAALDSEHVALDAADQGAAIRVTIPGEDHFLGIQMPCRP
jgi:DNA polymerase III subunit beta